MQKRTKVFFTFIFIIVLVIVLYIFTNWFSIITGYFGGEDEKVKLARCLTENGSEFYFREYCSECEKQKLIFGKAFDLIPQIDCGRNKENCPNIQSIPAWYIGKNFYYGFKSLSELKRISGCEK